MRSSQKKVHLQKLFFTNMFYSTACYALHIVSYTDWLPWLCFRIISNFYIILWIDSSSLVSLVHSHHVIAIPVNMYLLSLLCFDILHGFWVHCVNVLFFTETPHIYIYCGITILNKITLSHKHITKYIRLNAVSDTKQWHQIFFITSISS